MQPVEHENDQQPGLSAKQERDQHAVAMRATMEAQAALDQEEDQLVDEARRVGMKWPDIAAMLPTRQVAELKRRHSSHAAAQVATQPASHIAAIDAALPVLRHCHCDSVLDGCRARFDHLLGASAGPCKPQVGPGAAAANAAVPITRQAAACTQLAVL